MDSLPSSFDSAELNRELEIKYTVDPDQFPADLREALLGGDDHEDILRKGRITQHYLPVNPETVQMAVAAVQRMPKNEISPEEVEFFSQPENVSEIRILQREQDHLDEITLSEEERKADAVTILPDAFQISIKGFPSEDGSMRSVINTPITTDLAVAEEVVRLLESVRDEGASLSWLNNVDTIEKMWYDIQVQDPNHPDRPKVVELDVFPDLDYLAVAEIEFSDEEDRAQFSAHLPEWFDVDVTGDDAFKVRNLAGKTVEKLDPAVSEVMDQVREKLTAFAQPTVLGDKVNLLPAHMENDTFVVVGSFKRWIPQFRRITQDLKRKSMEVYPHINTLDVARRRLATNDPKAAFRIEAEEGQPLKEAERAYLTRIKNASALYVVVPEGRLGKSSGEETFYAMRKGKRVYLTKNIHSVSHEMPLELQILFRAVIHEILIGAKDFQFSHTDVTSLVRHYTNRAFDPELMEELFQISMNDLLKSSKEEDDRRMAIEAAEAEKE